MGPPSNATRRSAATGTAGRTSRQSSPVTNGRRTVQTEQKEDEGLIMREKDKGEGSVGKAGGVGVGVTRPKRRLSSLPSLPHPFLSGATHRALSATSSPPASPNGIPHPQQHHHHHHHPQPHSTYQALQNPISATPTAGYATYSRAAQGMDEKSALKPSPLQNDSSSPMLFGIELKWISLVTLALQNAFLTIIMHYSRISAAPSKTYSAASAVLLNELLKGTISVIVALKHIDEDMSQVSPSCATPLSEKESKLLRPLPSTSFTSWFQPSRVRNLAKQVLSPDCYKLSVPAILYVIQNNLQYVAASNLDVATFQVTYQMKILTTAFFSVLLLRKRLTKAKWASLVMLAIGVGIVQLQSTTAPAAQLRAPLPPHNHGIIQKESAQLRSDIPVAPSDSDAPLIASERVMHPFRGFLAVTLACMTSGLAGVYFEFILKSSSGSAAPPPDLWVRNTQLSLFSLIPALIPVLFGGDKGVGFFTRMRASFVNFNGWAIGTVLTQTLGGLITAIVIRYSDNIMKGFATSLSIIISFLASVALFSYPITFAFVFGSSIVLAATYLYNAPSSPSCPSTRTSMAVAPGSPILTSAPILGEPERPSRRSSVINLLGLGTASQASSRRPSASDLRTMAINGVSFGFTPTHSASTSMSTNVGTGMGMGMGTSMASGTGSWAGYSASAPGTPYPSSAGYPASSSMLGNPYDLNSSSSSSSSRTSPRLSLNVGASPGIGGPGGPGGPSGPSGGGNSGPTGVTGVTGVNGLNVNGLNALNGLNEPNGVSGANTSVVNGVTGVTGVNGVNGPARRGTPGASPSRSPAGAGRSTRSSDKPKLSLDIQK